MVLLYFGLYNIIDDFELLIRHWNGLDPLQWIGLLIASAELFLYRHANISSCWIYGIRLDCLLILYHPPVLWFPGFMLVCRLVPFFTPFRIVSNHCALFFSCACGFVMMAFLNFNCYDFTALLTLWLRLVHLCHWMPSFPGRSSGPRSQRQRNKLASQGPHKSADWTLICPFCFALWKYNLQLTRPWMSF